MKKLKNKVFFTIFSILTISLFSFVFIYNTENYIEQKKSIQNSLEIASNNKRKNTLTPPNQSIDESPKKDNNIDKREDDKEKA